MASKYDVISRGGVTLAEPQSGLDLFLGEIAKYASPEYQAQLKAEGRRDKEETRMDARLRVSEERWQHTQDETDKTNRLRTAQEVRNKSEEARKKILFSKQIQQYDDTEAMTDYKILSSKFDGNNDFDSKLAFLNSYNSDNENVSNQISADKSKLQSINASASNTYDILTNLDIGIEEAFPDYASMRTTLIKNPDKIDNFIINKILPDFKAQKSNAFLLYKEELTGITNQIKNVPIGTPPEVIEELSNRFSDKIQEGYRIFSPNISLDDDDLGGPDDGEIRTFNGTKEMYNKASNSWTDISVSKIPFNGEEIIKQIVSKSGGTPSQDEITSQLSQDEELGVLKTAAKEGSYLVPVTKKLSRAVQSSLSDMTSSLSDVVSSGDTEGLKNSLTNAINLHNSIDPKSGRREKGGAREMAKIKKKIMDIKKRAGQSKYRAGSIKHFQPDFIEFVNSISFKDGKIISNLNLESQNSGSPLVDSPNPFLPDIFGGGSLDTSFTRPADAPSDVPDWMLERIVN